MSPSSLIFVAVLAIWATYLVVHVLRRREHLATARTVDRFSAQMRVLQRRAVRVASEAPVAESVRTSSRPQRTRTLVAATSAETFLTASAEPASPGEVSPAVSATTAASATAASLATSAVDRVRTDTVTMPVVDNGDDVTSGVAERVVAAAPEPVSMDSSVPLSPNAVAPAANGRGASVAARPVRVPAATEPDRSTYRMRRVRAGLLLSTLLATVLTVALAGFGVVGWVAPLVSVAALAASVWWLRTAALAEQAARRRNSAVERRERARAELDAREAALAARPSAPALPVAQEQVARRPDPVDVAEAAAAEPRTQVIQVADTSVMRTIDPLLEDRAWAPTPVPPPTYTLKARAERPMPEPLEVPVPIEVDDDEIAWDEQRNQPRVVNA